MYIFLFLLLQLQYSILSGNKANLVYLNESTGLLTLSPYLDTNVPLTAKIEVLVSGKHTFCISDCKIHSPSIEDTETALNRLNRGLRLSSFLHYGRILIW